MEVTVYTKMVIKPVRMSCKQVDWGVEEDGKSKETRLVEFLGGQRVCDPLAVWTWQRYGRAGALQRARTELHRKYLESAGYTVSLEREGISLDLSTPRR